MLINLTIPVLNEEVQLADSLRKLREFLTQSFRHEFELVIANNASTDRTRDIADGLAREFPEVRAVHLEEKGRGRALRHVWRESRADILSYMDVDLSTDITFFPQLIDLVIAGADVAAGSRLSRESKVARGAKREFISRSYNWLIKAFFQTQFPDAQCGFKAVSRRAAAELLPLVADNGWFFDSELLILAEKLGYKVESLPVAWSDDPDSRVRIIATAIEDIKGLIRVRENLKRSVKAGSLRNQTASPTALK